MTEDLPFKVKDRILIIFKHGQGVCERTVGEISQNNKCVKLCHIPKLHCPESAWFLIEDFALIDTLEKEGQNKN